MKVNVKAFCVAVFCCGLLVSANAQINLLSNSITFRDYNNAALETKHYGDLRLDGGAAGSGWGWLYCNEIISNGYIYGKSLCVSKNANIYGALNVYGTKNFIQPHPTDSTKVIRYVAIESGEALTLARGTAKTQSSVVSIDLPEHFALVTSDEAPITVLLTPENAPVLLYTTKKTKSQIIVNMKQSDYAQFGDAEFSWQVTGVRDGFENQKVIVDIDSNGNMEDSDSFEDKNISTDNKRTGNMNQFRAVSQKRVVMNEKVKKLMDKRVAGDKKKEHRK